MLTPLLSSWGALKNDTSNPIYVFVIIMVFLSIFNLLIPYVL